MHCLSKVTFAQARRTCGGRFAPFVSPFSTAIKPPTVTFPQVRRTCFGRFVSIRPCPARIDRLAASSTVYAAFTAPLLYSPALIVSALPKVERRGMSAPSLREGAPRSFFRAMRDTFTYSFLLPQTALRAPLSNVTAVYHTWGSHLQVAPKNYFFGCFASVSKALLCSRRRYCLVFPR